MDDDRARFFEQAGIAALIPGYTDAINYMQAKRGELLARLAELQNGGAAARPKLGRPPKMEISPEGMEARKRAAAGYWAKMSRAEKTAEMQRRALKAGRKLRKVAEVDVEKLHPRDARSPRHAAYVAKLRKGQRKFWDNLTPEERDKRVGQMVKNRRAA